MSGNDYPTDANRVAAKGGKNTNADQRDPAKSALVHAAPSPEVIAATEFLLAQPDAYLYRRRYLDLITHTLGPDGTTVTDYTAAEKYLLTTADRCRRAIQRTTDLYAVPTRKPGNDASR